MEEGNLKACPDNEAISLYCDGELGLDTEARRHIDQCPACISRIEACRALGRMLKKSLESSADAGLAERVRFGVRKRLAEEGAPMSIPFPVLVARLAAAALVVFTVYFVAKVALMDDEVGYAVDNGHFMPQAGSGADAMNTEAPRSAKPVPAAVEFVDAGKAQVPSDVKKAGANSVGVSDMKTVSTAAGNSPDGILPAQSGAAQKKPAPIPRIVRHVWVVKDIDKADKKLREMVENFDPKDKLKSRKVKDDREKIVVKKIDKSSLVNLVKTLASEGYRLMTPVEPQPEAELFEGSASEPVKYYVDFVRG